MEQSDFERHKAEKREQTAQVLGQQTPARVGEGKKQLSTHNTVTVAYLIPYINQQKSIKCDSLELRLKLMLLHGFRRSSAI